MSEVTHSFLSVMHAAFLTRDSHPEKYREIVRAVAHKYRTDSSEKISKQVMEELAEHGHRDADPDLVSACVCQHLRHGHGSFAFADPRSPYDRTAVIVADERELSVHTTELVLLDPRCPIYPTVPYFSAQPPNWQMPAVRINIADGFTFEFTLPEEFASRSDLWIRNMELEILIYVRDQDGKLKLRPVGMGSVKVFQGNRLVVEPEPECLMEISAACVGKGFLLIRNFVQYDRFRQIRFAFRVPGIAPDSEPSSVWMNIPDLHQEKWLGEGRIGTVSLAGGISKWLSGKFWWFADDTAFVRMQTGA